MSRQITSIRQENGRYTQGGITDYHPTTIGNISSERLGWWEKRYINTRYDDVFFVISKANESRPDLISYHVYGKSEFAWLIMQYNNVVDPIEELLRGTKIRLPHPNRLKLQIIGKTFDLGN